MSKNKRIDGIYKILPMYENVLETKDDEVLNDYLAYLSRVYIRYIGYKNKEIAEIVKGLIHLQDAATQEDVHRVVFHMIDILEKEDDKYGNKLQRLYKSNSE